MTTAQSEILDAPHRTTRKPGRPMESRPMNSKILDRLPMHTISEQDSLTGLADQINAEHRQAEEAMNGGLQHALRAGKLLLKAKGLCAHGEWLPWLEQNFAGSTRTAQCYIGVERWSQIEGNAQRVAHLSFRDAVRIASESDEDASRHAHVGHNTGNNEWYTPPTYIEAARDVMGGIDCDPASSEIANRTVGATTFYTIEQDGLVQPWGNTVWMNPPYAQPLVANFAHTLVEKITSGEVEQACVLVNNATETTWFQEMLPAASALCFPRGRVRFLNSDGQPNGAPLQGQAIFYFGDRATDFQQAFQKYGWTVVLRRADA